MSLTLTVIGYAGEEYSEPFGHTFDESGGTVGRASVNDWELPDEEKVVSGKHAIVHYQDDHYTITDVSRNGVYVNDAGEPLGEGNSTRLEDGDVLHIGDYDIRVQLEVHTAPDTEFPTSAGPLNIATQDFFDEPVEPRAPTEFPGQEGDAFVAPVPAAREPFGPGHTSGELSTDGDFIPEDWDETDYEPIAAPNASEPVPQPPPPSPRTPKPRKPRPQRGREPPTRQGAAEPAPPPRAGAPDPALNQFLVGAGISDPDLAARLPPDVMLQVGKIFREAVQGTMSVLAARSRLKGEFRLNVTVLQPRENNPLKFSISAEEAAKHLLRPSAGGMQSVDAVREAFADLKAHEIAVMAGTKSALRELLRRFQPERFERREEVSSMLDQLLPHHRKAKCWEQFTLLYNELVEEAEDDFHRLFGEEFSRAYEQQMKVLRKH